MSINTDTYTNYLQMALIYLPVSKFHNCPKIIVAKPVITGYIENFPDPWRLIVV